MSYPYNSDYVYNFTVLLKVAAQRTFLSALQLTVIFLLKFIRYELPFNTLDMEEIQTTTINFGKVFNQLDKGVPPNKIVPKCKETIDIIKEKVRLF